MSMKCPHCRVSIYEATPEETDLGFDADGAWILVKRDCPECQRMILVLQNKSVVDSDGYFSIGELQKEFLIHPKSSFRPPCPPEVPKEFAEDYNEACLVISESPKASAALSRRCLQHVLREVATVEPGNLADEIQQVIDNGTLPSQLIEAIDAVRNIGNFAAHPTKSQKTGEILPVEPGEADWNLDVLEGLFDFYFVQPAIIKKKRNKLNQKLKEAGKPPMK